MAIRLDNGDQVQLGIAANHDHKTAPEGGIINQAPPIGSIIPFYDFNGGLTFDTNTWAYCDGSMATITGLGSSTLPDLSGRYLVGFGTDGGGDLDTASWATAAVGNAGHTANLSHSHTVNSHSHTVNSHSHTVNAHAHGTGSMQFRTGRQDNASLFMHDSSGSEVTVLTDTNTQSGGGVVRATVNSNSVVFWTTAGTGISTSSSPGTSSSSPGTSTSSPGTNSQLSSSQSIQPRSIRVRYLMRID